jgi:5-methylcytosine-specific restriction endonuclease McrA
MKNSLLIGKGGRVLDVVSWMKAIELTYFRDGGNAVLPLDYHNDKVHSVKEEFLVPSVIMLLGNRDRYSENNKMAMTRNNVFIRDDFTCQWCGKELSVTSGTIDHLYPTSKGGTNTWRNVVASCSKCNRNKGNKTKEEYEKSSGKKLLRNPFVPNRAVLFKSYLNKGYDCWLPYLEKFV